MEDSKMENIQENNVIEKKKKKVAIVGFAPSSRDKAPYNDPDWEIWVLNEYNSILPSHGANNVALWFEIHQRDTVLKSNRDSSYIDKLKNSKIPILMCEKHDDIPMSMKYPLHEIIEKLETDYFTNSISYMVAYALYVGVDEIAIYGVDMAQDEEYAKERPSVEYFVGYARAKGIPVYIPSESDICKVPYYYGFEEESAQKICRTIDPKLNDLKTRIQNDDFQMEEMQEYMDFKLKKYLFEYLPLTKKIKDADEKIGAIQQKLQTEIPDEEKQLLSVEVQKIQGALPNLALYIYQLDELIMGIWNDNQTMKGAKKERLFLAGAENMTAHLRKILCPYD